LTFVRHAPKVKPKADYVFVGKEKMSFYPPIITLI